MDTPALLPHQTVKQILQRSPDAAAIFLQAGTDCPGCLLSRFCTLEEVASYYGLHTRTLIETLLAPVQSNPPFNQGASHESIS